MTRDQIIERVQYVMDEVNALSEGITIADAQIEGQLDSSAVSLLQLLPPFLSDTSKATPEINDKIITTPGDFLKIARLKLDTWNVTLTSLLMETNNRVMYEHYEGLRAHENNPLGVAIRDGSNITIMVSPVGTIEVFKYVKRPTAAEELPDRLIDLFSWHVAGVIYGIHEEVNLQKICNEKTSQLIQIALQI